MIRVRNTCVRYEMKAQHKTKQVFTTLVCFKITINNNTINNYECVVVYMFILTLLLLLLRIEEIIFNNKHNNLKK